MSSLTVLRRECLIVSRGSNRESLSPVEAPREHGDLKDLTGEFAEGGALQEVKQELLLVDLLYH